MLAAVAAALLGRVATSAEVPAPPAIRITSPLGRVGEPGVVRIVAQVQAAPGTALGPVRFYIDAQLVGSVDHGPPYAVEWLDDNPFERREILVEVEDGLGRFQHLGLPAQHLDGRLRDEPHRAQDEDGEEDRPGDGEGAPGAELAVPGVADEAPHLEADEEEETEAADGAVELVSLEDADAETSEKDAVVTTEDDIEVEDDIGGEDDDTFLEEDEEGDDDVSDLIDGDIEGDEDN